MPVFDVIELPFCKVLRIGAWNEPPHSYFVAYHVENDFRHVLGLPVIDEFCTFSSPIFFAPIPILGKIYNAGISLGHKRDPEMSIDTGWPPLCVGYEAPAPELATGWEATLLAAIQQNPTAEPPGAAEEYVVQRAVIHQTEVIATNAPLVPEQLRRICRSSSKASFRIAFATGNRLVRAEKAVPQQVSIVSEAVLTGLIQP